MTADARVSLWMCVLVNYLKLSVLFSPGDSDIRVDANFACSSSFTVYPPVTVVLGIA